MTKNPHAQAMARLALAAGAQVKGGIARMKKLSAAERRALAKKAVRVRWAKARKKR